MYIDWDCFSRNGLWGDLTDGKFYLFIRQFWRQANVSRYGRQMPTIRAVQGDRDNVLYWSGIQVCNYTTENTINLCSIPFRCSSSRSHTAFDRKVNWLGTILFCNLWVMNIGAIPQSKVRCRYKAVDFLQNIQETHATTRASYGVSFVDMECHLIDMPPQFLQWCVQYQVMLDCVITALDCM